MVTTMSDTKYFPERTLEHGAWKKHKYIRKDGKKYIYQETRELDDGTSQDIYKDEETGETIHQNNNFKYDPERPDYRKKAVEKTKELVSKVTDKEDPDTGEKAKGDYVDEEEKKRKYFVKHDDMKKSDSLAHHGVKGQKWGVRRYQNIDGTLTSEGKKRASEGMPGVQKTLQEGHSIAYRKRFFAGLKGAVAGVGTLGGATGIGAGIGSLFGPEGTAIGAGVGYLSGAVASIPVTYLTTKKSSVGASVIEDEYRMAAKKMLESPEIRNVKVSEIQTSDMNAKANKQKYDKDNKTYNDLHDKVYFGKASADEKKKYDSAKKTVEDKYYDTLDKNRKALAKKYPDKSQQEIDDLAFKETERELE